MITSAVFEVENRSVELSRAFSAHLWCNRISGARL
jgi:hypothetical protein